MRLPRVRLSSVTLALIVAAAGCEKPGPDKPVGAIVWNIEIVDVSAHTQLHDAGTIAPGSIGNLYRPTEGNFYIVVRTAVQNTSNRENSYSPERFTLRDVQGRTYKTLGLLLDDEKPTVAMGMAFEGPFAVGPGVTETSPARTSLIFQVPNDAHEFRLEFPNARPRVIKRERDPVVDTGVEVRDPGETARGRVLTVPDLVRHLDENRGTSDTEINRILTEIGLPGREISGQGTGNVRHGEVHTPLLGLGYPVNLATDQKTAEGRDVFVMLLLSREEAESVKRGAPVSFDGIFSRIDEGPPGYFIRVLKASIVEER